MKQTARIIRNNIPYTLLSNGVQYGEALLVPTVELARLLPNPPPLAITIGSADADVTGTYYWNSTSTATDDGVTAIKLAASTIGRFLPVSLVSGGSGTGLSVATTTALKAVLSTTLTDTQPATVQTPGSNWVWSSSTGAGFESDDLTVVRPNNILLAQNGRWYNTSSSPVVPTIAALRLAVSGKQASVVVQSYSALDDGGGGTFDFDASDTTSSDNIGTIVVAGTRRYKRRFNGTVFAAWFGVVANDVTKDSTNPAALEAAATYLHDRGGGELRLPYGTVYVDRAVNWNNLRNVQFVGEPANLSEGDGSWIRVSADALLGTSIINARGMKSCAFRHVGVYGLDQNDRYSASIGINMSVLDGSHVTFDVVLEHCVAYGIANPSENLHKIHTTSNLAIDEAAIPDLTLTGMTGVLADGFPGTGLCYPVVMITDVSGGTARGQAKFQYSLDGGKTFNGSDITTAATYTVPTTALVFHFPTGTYAVTYKWEGKGWGIYLGSRIESGIDTQCDTVKIKDFACTSCAVGVVYDSTQAIAISLIDADIVANVHGVIVHACSFVRVDGGQISSISQGRSVITTRRCAGDVEYNGIYVESFGGDGFDFPVCARSARTSLTNCRVLLQNADTVEGRASRNINYQQGGNIFSSGCSWEALGGFTGSVHWIGASLVPNVMESRNAYVGSMTRTVTNAAYEGFVSGPNTGTFGDRFHEFTNTGARFSPVATSASPVDPTELPPCAVFCNDASPAELVFTNVDKKKNLGLLADSLGGLVHVENGLRLGSSLKVLYGVDTPEGAVTAPVGSLFLRSNGGAGTTFYVKESGTGNTGWVGK